MKNKLKYLNPNKEKQAGVSLLLAILVLASVLSISFSLTTILFIEVRSSADLLKTEGALYGATGVGEQAFFNLSRDVVDAPYVSDFNNNVSLKDEPEVVTNIPPIFRDKVNKDSTFDTTLNKYDFCGITATTSGCSIGKVTVTYIPSNNYTDNLYAYLCEWDPTDDSYTTLPCTTQGLCGGGGSYWKTPVDAALQTSCGVQLSQSVNTASWEINPSLQQELILTNPTGLNNIYFSVATFEDIAGTVPKGLPYVGRTAVTVDAQSGSVGRRIQVVVPQD